VTAPATKARIKKESITPKPKKPKAEKKAKVGWRKTDRDKLKTYTIRLF
jgi:hypothetical protein